MELIHKQSKDRVFLLDEIRGFAIICMVIYHTVFNLVFVLGADIPIFFSPAMNVIRDVFAGAFIFISGSVCLYSRSNARRGILCLALGMLLTLVTAIAGEEYIIRFGILHMLGLSMAVFAAAQPAISKLPVKTGIILLLALFVLTCHIDDGYIGLPYICELSLPYRPLYSANIYQLGFPSNDFYSTDYFPLIPWIFVFFAGSCFGRVLKNDRAPRFFYKSHSRFLQAAGRNTIWIYLIHQPVIYGAMMLTGKI